MKDIGVSPAKAQLSSPGSNTSDSLLCPNITLSLYTFFFFFVFLPFLGPLSAAYGGFQARGPIGAVAAGLCHSHSNTGSELSLQPTPQLTATPDP